MSPELLALAAALVVPAVLVLGLLGIVTLVVLSLSEAQAA